MSHVQVSRSDRERLRSISTRYAALDRLGLVKGCQRPAASRGKVVFPSAEAATGAAQEMSTILGFIQDVYQCGRHFHLATPRQASLSRLDSHRTEKPREGE